MGSPSVGSVLRASVTSTDAPDCLLDTSVCRTDARKITVAVSIARSGHSPRKLKLPVHDVS
jgi:hypothetical protein